MRLRARVDDNQKEIVAGLRKMGASVQSIAAMGGGVPDLLVGYRGVNLLLEVKDGRKPPSGRKLTEDEAKWHRNWTGQVVVVECLEDAVEALLKEAVL